MNKKEKNTIGIIGGAGPMAGILLTKKIMTNCQKVYGCMNDYDYPKLIFLSYPFGEMLKPNTVLQEESKVQKELKEALDFLVDNGADYFGIACNTLHGFLDGTCYSDKLINLIRETQSYFSVQRYSKILVLCTNTSVQKNIHKFSSKLLPNAEEQEFVDCIIKAVLDGSFSFQDSQLLKALILSKVEEDPNIDTVLLGCSELSVLLDEFPIGVSGIRIIDPLDILSSKLCQLIFKNKEDYYESICASQLWRLDQ